MKLAEKCVRVIAETIAFEFEFSPVCVGRYIKLHPGFHYRNVFLVTIFKNAITSPSLQKTVKLQRMFFQE